MHNDIHSFPHQPPAHLLVHDPPSRSGRLASSHNQSQTIKLAQPLHRPTAAPLRTLFLSTYPPEECGLAAFTKDAADAVDDATGQSTSTVMAIRRDPSLRYSDQRVRHVLDDAEPQAYRVAAALANDDRCDVVSIQHEFGLYAGAWGASILDFAARCRKPIVTTFHTLMPSPAAAPRRIVQHLTALSSSVVVMTHAAAALLVRDFGVAPTRVAIIPHGVPAMTRPSDEACKISLGLKGRSVLCTFGLMSQGKGLEHMIDAMPQIVAACPQATYVIAGVTHPVVKRSEGERYRESLVARAAALGVSEHIRFVNRFLEMPDLVRHLGACDVYITPYPSPHQIASGTLAYAMAAGRAIVSTPYIYAEEVLADDRGVLVPFGSSQGLADAVCELLANSDRRSTLQRRAAEYAHPMRWPAVGREYVRSFESVRSSTAPVALAYERGSRASAVASPPETRWPTSYTSDVEQPATITRSHAATSQPLSQPNGPLELERE